MKRSNWRRLALARLADARALRRAGRWSATYYLTGYVVECSLKACIARTFRQGVIPEKGSVDRLYVHDLSKLLGYADLHTALAQEIADDPVFAIHWGNVVRWKETARYELAHTRQEAEDLLNGVADPQHGVLRWLQQHW